MKARGRNNKDSTDSNYSKDNVPILSCFAAIYLVVIGILELIR